MGQHAKPSDGSINNRGATRVCIFSRCHTALHSPFARRRVPPWRCHGDLGPRRGREAFDPAQAHLQPPRRDQASAPDDSGLDQVEPFAAPLVTVSALRPRPESPQQLLGLSLPRPERLIGAGSRPWLPGAFCAAASLPHLTWSAAARASRSAKPPPPRRAVSSREPSFSRW